MAAARGLSSGAPVSRIGWRRGDPIDALLSREWLVTSGLGGYATGTIAGVCTRRYHGLLISALPTPLGRVMMLHHLSEQVRLADGTVVRLGGEEQSGALDLWGAEHLVEFRLDDGLPVWTFALGDVVIEKRVRVPHLQNTVHVTYSLARGDASVRLKLRPAVHFRPHDAPVSAPLALPYALTTIDDRYELSATGAHLPPLRLRLRGHGAAFTVEGRRLAEVMYRVESSRGYADRGDLWSPGYFRADIARGAPVTLVASTEAWETIEALTPTEARAAEHERRIFLLAPAPALAEGVQTELALAADQFLIVPAGRVEDAARAHAEGEEPRTVIAGYHWFTDWGRDTMISLEGLTLVTRRHDEARWILHTFGRYVRDGLIPNLYPEGSREALYHTADATLWFFHAIDRYLAATGDRATLRLLLPKLEDIVAHHLRGTRFHIGVDPADGLLRQGEPGYALTWMDARCDDWVVTPRRGKAVEINALWYNALRLLQRWLAEEGSSAAAGTVAGEADRVQRSFNARFWNPAKGYLYDVVDGEMGDDDACRPNQIFSISLPNPVLARAHWRSVVEVARDRLLTPVGLRSLSPDHPDYRPSYHGDLRTRDAAYHQGTVWSWLIGPFCDAWLKVWPDDRAGARRLLDGLVAHLGDACIGQVSEVFDAEPPYTPRGCVAQAWGVAELLRCLSALGDRHAAASGR